MAKLVVTTDFPDDTIPFGGSTGIHAHVEDLEPGRDVTIPVGEPTLGLAVDLVVHVAPQTAGPVEIGPLPPTDPGSLTIASPGEATYQA